MGLKLHGKEQKPILVWGGAGAVGTAAIQLAKAAGCSPIITTASSKNHEVLLSLGADKCFDYHDEDVEQKITAYMNGIKFPFVFDAVVAGADANHPSSTHICESLGTPDAKFAAPLPVTAPTREWPRVFACRNTDFDFVLPNGSKIEHKANLLWQEKMDEAFVWALEHYGNGFRMPNVKVVKGAEKGLEALRASAAGKATWEVHYSTSTVNNKLLFYCKTLSKYLFNGASFGPQPFADPS
jgi:threonine dehydrogenase-like Zn-dependent dehydrogenase